MEAKKITIHAGLGELKKLGQRIDKHISSALFIGSMKMSADKVSNTNSNKEDFSKEAVAQHQSIEELIALRDKMKAAIVLSNATTQLEVGNVTMTVAEAIEKKSSIDYKKTLLLRMRRQYKEALMYVTTYNEKMEDNLEVQVSNLAGKDANAKSNLTGFMEEYRKQNGWIAVDPLNIKEKIDALESEISDFETNIDVALSVSNATTFIEV